VSVPRYCNPIQPPTLYPTNIDYHSYLTTFPYRPLITNNINRTPSAMAALEFIRKDIQVLTKTKQTRNNILSTLLKAAIDVIAYATRPARNTRRYAERIAFDNTSSSWLMVSEVTPLIFFVASEVTSFRWLTAPEKATSSVRKKNC